MTSKLLPCPFCGGEARIAESDTVYWVKCTECRSEGSPDVLNSKAVAAWNRRAAQPAAGEPNGWRLVPIEPLMGMMSDKDHDTRIKSERTLLAMLDKAPPAAAHGDEAVRKDAEYFRFIESCPIRTGVVFSRKAHEPGFDLRAECERVMAMRAQGDGHD